MVLVRQTSNVLVNLGIPKHISPPPAPHLYSHFQSLSAYCSSLAHKTNHSFLPNGQFVVYDHPKFGLIPCISTIADIEEGEEVRYKSRL